jgi:hypothetical protein
MAKIPDELVEKVARAICVSERMNDDDPNGGWRCWVEAAEVALEAAGVGDLIYELTCLRGQIAADLSEVGYTESDIHEQLHSVDALLTKVGAAP